MAVLNGERMHDTMERLLPGARSAALLWQGAAVLGGAALGAGQVYGGAAPFGLALVIGCPPSYCLAAALGTLAAGLAFQPMLLGFKLAVAAVAAAAVRRLIDGRPGAGALAGCLTLTAAQVLQIVLAGGLFNPGQTVTVGCTALLAAVFGWAFAHFSAREPRGVCLWLAVATACLQRCAVGPLAPGLALAAGAGLCAAIGGTLEQTAVLSIALAAAITAASPNLCYAALGHWPRPTLSVCCRWRSVPGWALWLRWLCRGACCTKFSRRPRRPCRRRAWAGRRASSPPWRTR